MEARAFLSTILHNGAVWQLYSFTSSVDTEGVVKASDR